jgi:hypothetical protein
VLDGNGRRRLLLRAGGLLNKAITARALKASTVGSADAAVVGPQGDFSASAPGRKPDPYVNSRWAATRRECLGHRRRKRRRAPGGSRW